MPVVCDELACLRLIQWSVDVLCQVLCRCSRSGCTWIGTAALGLPAGLCPSTCTRSQQTWRRRGELEPAFRLPVRGDGVGNLLAWCGDASPVGTAGTAGRKGVGESSGGGSEVSPVSKEVEGLRRTGRSSWRPSAEARKCGPKGLQAPGSLRRG